MKSRLAAAFFLLGVLLGLGVGLAVSPVRFSPNLIQTTTTTQTQGLLFKQLIQFQKTSFGQGFEKNFTFGQDAVWIVAQYHSTIKGDWYLIIIRFYSANPNERLLILPFYYFLRPYYGQTYETFSWEGVMSANDTLSLYLYQGT